MLSKSELLKKCQEQGFVNYKSKTKKQLIALLSTELSNESVEPIKPFLKWVGGKSQIINHVIELFPKEINNYHEPFLGGGSVLFALLSHKKAGTIVISGKIYASDLNSNLIGLYKNIQSNPDELIEEVKKISGEFFTCKKTIVNRKALNIEEAMTSPESYYFWIRSRFNNMTREERLTVTGSAMLLFMNKTCFRGVYREGPNGFNVPFGNYKNPSIINENHIKMVSSLIEDVIFNVSSFVESLSIIENGDFVYLDPPYAPENTSSFVSYTSDGFNLSQHELLFEICNGMHEKNVKMLLSNADVKLVRDSFQGYTIKSLLCKRTINSKDPDAHAKELLISN